MPFRPFAFVLALLLTAGASSTAFAQPSTGEAATRPGGHRISGELDFFHEGAGMMGFAVLSPAFYGRFRLVDGRHGLDAESGAGAFVLDLDVKWRGVGLAGNNEGSFRMGNPYVGARAGIDSNAFTARAGVGVTLPVTNLYDDGSTDFGAYGYGAALHGVWESWLLLPQTFAFVVPVDVQFRTSVFTVGADAAFAVLASVPKMGPSSDPYISLQLGGYGAFIPIPLLAVGLRFQAVLLSNTGGRGLGSGDEGYLALVPFARLNLDGGFLEARLYMNLDDPFGFAFDTGKVWSLSISGGADF